MTSCTAAEERDRDKPRSTWSIANVLGSIGRRQATWPLPILLRQSANVVYDCVDGAVCAVHSTGKIHEHLKRTMNFINSGLMAYMA